MKDSVRIDEVDDGMFLLTLEWNQGGVWKRLELISNEKDPEKYKKVREIRHDLKKIICGTYSNE